MVLSGRPPVTQGITMMRSPTYLTLVEHQSSPLLELPTCPACCLFLVSSLKLLTFMLERGALQHGIQEKQQVRRGIPFLMAGL